MNEDITRAVNLLKTAGYDKYINNFIECNGGVIGSGNPHYKCPKCEEYRAYYYRIRNDFNKITSKITICCNCNQISFVDWD